MSEEKINSLVILDKKAFSRREWVALKYAQQWIFMGGKDPIGNYMDEYLSFYSSKERKCILKVIRQMDFFNAVSELFSNREKSACRIDIDRQTNL